jgi:4-diphosphocytidyl-2-C-methyl-D-erythritol kinase
MKRYGIKGGVRISINKNIPVSAGLAGGSSDAAAVLKGINILYELGLDREAMKNAAACVGSDVPFCIEGGTAFAEGTGTRLRQLPPHEGFSLLIVAPCFEVKTSWAYAGFDSAGLPVSERPDTNLLIDALSRSQTALMAANMKNVLESVTAAEYPLIRLLKKSLTECGALGSIMSGSGPSVFGIFENRSTAEKAAKQIESILNEENLSAGQEGGVAAAYFVTQTTCASGLTNNDSIADKSTFIGNNKAADDTSLPEE